MSSHLTSPAHTNGIHTTGLPLRDLPKSSTLTSNLPADPDFPTPISSHKTPRKEIGPKLVKNALYTYVRPDTHEQTELLSVSPRALRDLGIRQGDEKTQEFRDTVSGNRITTWDESTEEGIYPWAQCYGGFQFGSWAAQLGDGRAISLFETTNPSTRKRYELQLKGAGRTPYSRFADGKAVLRSSIREYVVSEALNALGIPTTRALSLTLLPKEQVVRERMEPAAIVARFAESWIRLGTFDLLRSRGYRKETRILGHYVAEHVLGGWEALPGRVPAEEVKDTSMEVFEVKRGVSRDTLEGPQGQEENRFARMYREVVRRNAATVAKWQVYGFMNGVLNTDNTSIYGLSIDYGPFAFMDNFDPDYTPNHDDHMLRYSYRNQPSIIWWNLVRLGEDLGELIGAGAGVDDETFVEKGVEQDDAEGLIKRAESVIKRAGQEYGAVFMQEYKKGMSARFGLRSQNPDDFQNLFSEWLDTLEALQLDFNQSFRKLCDVRIAELEMEEQRREVAGRFFHAEGVTGVGENDGSARNRLAKWLDSWRTRIAEDWGKSPESEEQRQAGMRKVNPKFTPKGWVLDEIIARVEKKAERDVLRRVMDMSLRPFEEKWEGHEDEERWCGDVPRYNRAMQCSCSS
ncbi:MAG: hypothetical protein Q9162_001336 [Coniocarpon cinnabarinum]